MTWLPPFHFGPWSLVWNFKFAAVVLQLHVTMDVMEYFVVITETGDNLQVFGGAIDPNIHRFEYETGQMLKVSKLAKWNTMHQQKC
jgi:hypothetical protein